MEATNATGNHTHVVPAVPQDSHDIVFKVFVGMLLVSILLVTLMGNCLVIISVATYRRLRSTTNMFIVSLAVADLTVAILVMPYAIALELNNYAWSFGWIFCHFWISSDVMCCTASILHLCLISLDRYLAITKPYAYRKMMSKRRAILCICIVWFCSVTISFLPIFQGWYAKKGITLYKDVGYCRLTVNRIYAIVSATLSFYAPLFVMIFVYFRIYKIAYRQAEDIRRLEISLSQNGADEKTRNKKNVKAIKTLGILMGLFIVCWLPFFVMYLVFPFCSSCLETFPAVAGSILTWLGYLNSTINPTVYAFTNRDFRKAFKRILACTRISRCCRLEQNFNNVPLDRIPRNNVNNTNNVSCQEYIFEDKPQCSEENAPLAN